MERSKTMPAGKMPAGKMPAGKMPAGKYAWAVTVGEKGQIVIPKQARELFDIHPGDTLLLLGDEQLGIAIPPKTELAMFGSRIFGEKEGKDAK